MSYPLARLYAVFSFGGESHVGTRLVSIGGIEDREVEMLRTGMYECYVYQPTLGALNTM